MTTIRQEEWNGLRPGDAVIITGKRGTWRFLAYCKSPKGEWVAVYGGSTINHQHSRSFAPELVKPKRVPRKRKES